MKWLKTLAVLTLLPSLAMAQDDTPATYSPEFCEFEITFPDDPYSRRRCDDTAGRKCYDQVSYTKVYEMTSTVNFRVICNQVTEDIRKNYSGEVMEATLKAMTDNNIVKTFDTSFREEEKYKQAGLVGEGKVGRTPTIYIAQLWIGDQSAMSVEAELIGEANAEADALFSNILKSVQYKDMSEVTDDDAGAEAKDDDAKTEE